jgi:hypothetical protein
MHVTVRGDGVAARCCIRLLGRAGLSVALQSPARPKLPAIMIGATTQKLFRDVFERDDLFDRLLPVASRVVAWGPGASPRVLPHSAVVVSEQELLWRLNGSAAVEDDAEQPSWLVAASRPLPDACIEQHFGARTATAVPVRFRAGADRSACWIESLENGWAFLIPAQDDKGWLLAVGDAGHAPLADSRLVSAQIAEITGEPAVFPSHPRIAWPLCGPGWLACGTGALAFDPLCGDGSGHAVREAILAAAVLRSIDIGEECEELLAHYRSRLLAGFMRHLETCEDFYRTGGSTPWWQTQVQAARDGLNWCAGELRSVSRVQYQLLGFDLERVPVPPDRAHHSF